MGWKQRRRRGKRGRFPKPINIEKDPTTLKFIPVPEGKLDPIHIESAELEALMLVDLKGLSQEEAGARLGVSRGTVWRLLQSVRKKIAQAISEGRTINIVPFATEGNRST